MSYTQLPAEQSTLNYRTIYLPPGVTLPLGAFGTFFKLEQNINNISLSLKLINKNKNTIVADISIVELKSAFLGSRFDSIELTNNSGATAPIDITYGDGEYLSPNSISSIIQPVIVESNPYIAQIITATQAAAPAIGVTFTPTTDVIAKHIYFNTTGTTLIYANAAINTGAGYVTIAEYAPLVNITNSIASSKELYISGGATLIISANGTGLTDLNGTIIYVQRGV